MFLFLDARSWPPPEVEYGPADNRAPFHLHAQPFPFLLKRFWRRAESYHFKGDLEPHQYKRCSTVPRNFPALALPARGVESAFPETWQARAPLHAAGVCALLLICMCSRARACVRVCVPAYACMSVRACGGRCLWRAGRGMGVANMKALPLLVTTRHYLSEDIRCLNTNTF